jgi:hypothetical protein
VQLLPDDASEIDVWVFGPAHETCSKAVLGKAVGHQSKWITSPQPEQISSIATCVPAAVGDAGQLGIIQ